MFRSAAAISLFSFTLLSLIQHVASSSHADELSPLCQSTVAHLLDKSKSFFGFRLLARLLVNDLAECYEHVNLELPITSLAGKLIALMATQEVTLNE